MSRLVVGVASAYLLAAIPVGAIALAGIVTPLYRMPRAWYARCWSWMALILVASAIALRVAGDL